MRILRLGLLACVAVGLFFVPVSLARRTPVVHPTAPKPFVAELVACPDLLASDECETARRVFVDYDALGVPTRSGGEWLAYDYDEVIGPVSADQLQHESTLSVAVRLLLSEIGPERMLESDFGLNEAVGILYTVSNRLDPIIANPEGVDDAPRFPGCDEDGDFISCAEPEQYLGLLTRRGLDPQTSFEPDALAQATDLAVLAWWLHRQEMVSDPTEGATNYVHRCGGAAYGMTTPHCDGHIGRPRGDVRGADPHAGPIVFYAPTVFQERRGVYGLRVSRWIDYVHESDQDAPSWEELAEVDVDDPLRPW